MKGVTLNAAMVEIIVNRLSCLRDALYDNGEKFGGELLDDLDDTIYELGGQTHPANPHYATAERER